MICVRKLVREESCRDRRILPATQSPWFFLILSLVFALHSIGADAADCNGNGVRDRLDTSRETSADCNENRIPDECDLVPLQFGLRPGIDAGVSPRHLRAVDFEGDGDIDLVAVGVDNDGARIGLFTNDGAGVYSRRDLLAGRTASDLSIGDVDGDGRSDLVVLDTADVRVFFGGDDGSFTPADSIPVSTNAFALAVGDLDGDGDGDVAVTDRRADEVRLLINEGREFVPGGSFAVGDFPVTIEAIDLDDDGLPELVTADRTSATITILVNQGGGIFAPRPALDVGDARPLALVGADLDLDGDVDLAVIAQGSVVFFHRTDGGDYTRAGQFIFEGRPASLGATDLNDDGMIDLYAPISNNGTIALLMNDGAGGFVAPNVLALETPPRETVAGDVDGDGDVDLVVAETSTGHLGFFLNNESSAIAFAAATVIVGTRPHSATTGDVDGDGLVDVITADGSDMTVTNLLSDGTGRLVRSRQVNFNTYINSITAGDWDDDGDLDIALAGIQARRILVLTNVDGAGTFGRVKNFTAGASPFHVENADLNGDGAVDILCSNQDQNTLSLFFNRADGSGTFDAQVVVPVGRGPRCSVAGDWDGDGDLDVAVANHLAPSFGLSVLKNGGGGDFTAPAVELDSVHPFFVAAGDLNGDEFSDLAAAEEAGRSVRVFLNSGSGTFPESTRLASGQAPYSLITVDVNADGFRDLVTANQGPNNLSILLGRGDGSFAASLTFGVGVDPRFVLALDLDADDDADLVAANHTSRNVTVLMNASTPALAEPWLEHVCTEADFALLARPSLDPGVVRTTKYTVPVDRGAANVVPPVVQNVGRYEFHEDFLEAMYPEEFPPGVFTGLTSRRVTRRYFIGILYELETSEGRLYGFDVIVDPSPTERLTQTELTNVYDAISQLVALRPLAYYPTERGARADAAEWAVDAPFPVFLEDLSADVDFVPYTQSVGYGRVRRLDREAFAAANETGEMSFQSILVLDHAPRDIEGVVGGVITAELQGELSHVAIRTARRGTPNAFVRDATERFAEWDGQLVRLEVGPEGYDVRAATDEEATRFWEENQPTLSSAPQIDRDYAGLPTLEDIAAMESEGIEVVARVGGKASNFARLQTVLDGDFADYREVGFAVPVRRFIEFMTENEIESITGDGSVSYAAHVAELLADPEFQTSSTVRFARLAALRQHIREESVVPSGLVTRIAVQIARVFGSTSAAVRFRSSSNVEDALEFNGAGLYDSTSACAADDLDTDREGPSRCDGSRDVERGVARALRVVWSSLWNFRAFEERAFWGIPTVWLHGKPVPNRLKLLRDYVSSRRRADDDRRLLQLPGHQWRRPLPSHAGRSRSCR